MNFFQKHQAEVAAADEIAHKAELAAQYNKVRNREGHVVSTYKEKPCTILSRAEPHITF